MTCFNRLLFHTVYNIDIHTPFFIDRYTVDGLFKINTDMNRTHTSNKKACQKGSEGKKEKSQT